MKSEKAKELIEKYAVGNSRDAAPSMMKGRVIECVELAEQEAEERMRRKAVEAFDDMWINGGGRRAGRKRSRFTHKPV